MACVIGDASSEHTGTPTHNCMIRIYTESNSTVGSLLLTWDLKLKDIFKLTTTFHCCLPNIYSTCGGNIKQTFGVIPAEGIRLLLQSSCGEHWRVDGNEVGIVEGNPTFSWSVGEKTVQRTVHDPCGWEENKLVCF